MQTATCPHCNEPTEVDEEDKITETSKIDAANPFNEEPEAECDSCNKMYAYSIDVGLF
ncbi:hypothetical protein [Natrinema versiforme]|uniref:hypothetical protein n=1 Tax=Natrinema versiforme TaxID=88724 RepID=UPI001586DD30|nr:hypothetical protein [Natrinema versiforme]